tara:strand:+ start:4647 stop:6215 length:1569 start_codon:yes stop_codon:yes gene_type:complete
VAKEIFDISGLQTGFTFNSDLSPYDMPANMFSSVQNVRFNDKQAGSIEGHISALGTPTVAPYWTTSWRQSSTNLWIYGGLTALHKITGTTHADVTRSSGAYTTLASTGKNWQGDALGGVLVVNNGIDVPQSYLQSGSRFVDLAHWPSTLRCQVIVPFRNHLIALNLTDDGTELPYSIRWSDAIPEGASNNGSTTWTTASTASESSQITVGGTKGHLLNAIPLGNDLMVYKEDSIYSLTFTGGTFTFALRERFKDIGLFSRDAVVQISNNEHVLVSTNDVVMHNGSTLKSVIDDQVRTYLFSQIDSASASKTFLVHNKVRNEVWICYPKTNATNGFPDEALIWNYRDNTWSIRALPGVNYIARGIVNPDLANTWTATSTTWAADTLTWAQQPYNPTIDSLLMCGTNDTKLYLADSGITFDGTAITSRMERVGLHAGNPSAVKSITKVFPRIEGTGTVNISVGAELQANQGVSYSDPVSFTIGTDSEIDCRVRGRYLALKFENTTGNQFNMSGYAVESEAVSDR